MGMRWTWKGHLRFSLITIPVKTYSSTSKLKKTRQSRVHLEQVSG
jgi:non-homologous end joining protein Ku